MTWKLSQDPPPYGGMLLTLTATSADETESLQLRYATANGAQLNYSVLTDDAEIHLPGQPMKSTPREIRAMIPSNAIIELGAGFHWSAELVRNIYPVNSCPGALQTR